MKYLPWVAFVGMVLSAWAATVEAAEAPSGSDGADREAVALVEKLGDGSFDVRTRADAQLRDLGRKAQAELTAGLAHGDPEVRRRCRWILEDVLQADFAKRLEAFAADSDSQHDHGLPGWPRFRETLGDDAGAREFYVKMLKRESGLLVSAASSPAAAAESAMLRLQQIYRQMTINDAKQRKSPEMETIAALLFVVIDPQSKLPDELADNPYLSNVIQQPGFQQALASGDYQAVARKLLGRWVLCPTGPRLLHIKFHLATQHKIPEGIALALSTLENGKALGGHFRAYALGAVGSIGGKPYAGVLAEFLDDETECYRRTVNNKTYATEARDVALAWLVYLTGQPLEDYGLEKVKPQFDQVKKNPHAAMNLHNSGFEEDDGREKAMKRWREWVEKHPLPEIPADARGPESRSVVVLGPAPAPVPAQRRNPKPRGKTPC